MISKRLATTACVAILLIAAPAAAQSGAIQLLGNGTNLSRLGGAASRIAQSLSASTVPAESAVQYLKVLDAGNDADVLELLAAIRSKEVTLADPGSAPPELVTLFQELPGLSAASLPPALAKAIIPATEPSAASRLACGGGTGCVFPTQLLLAAHIGVPGASPTVDAYRHYSLILGQAGLSPRQVRVVKASTGPEAEWRTVNVKGQPAVRLIIRNASGKLPTPLKSLLASRGIKDIKPASRSVLSSGAPIDHDFDISKKAIYDRAISVADRIMANKGIDATEPQWAMMRYAMARYVFNGTTDAGLAWLDRYYEAGANLDATDLVGPRWIEKIDRALADPFTNDDAAKLLEYYDGRFRDALTFIREQNTRNAPIKFYAAGSTTKGRFGGRLVDGEVHGSDMDILIETPDAELQETILTSPFGFRGGNPDEFAILNKGYYDERGRFFGVPAYVGDDIDELLEPGSLPAFFRRFSAERWGVELSDGTESVTARFTDQAVETFEREAPMVTEYTYEQGRMFGGGSAAGFVTAYWEDLVDAPDGPIIPGDQLVKLGEALIQEALPSRFSPAAIDAWLVTPAGRAFLARPDTEAFLGEHDLKATGLGEALASRTDVDPGALFHYDDVSSIIGISDPMERLMFGFAANGRIKALADEGATNRTALGEELRAALTR